jgi:hypothetical protein
MQKTYHVKGGLGNPIMLAREDFLKRANGVLEGIQLALVTREDLGNGKGLGHETLRGERER